MRSVLAFGSLARASASVSHPSHRMIEQAMRKIGQRELSVKELPALKGT
jgi:hypothetical protein